MRGLLMLAALALAPPAFAQSSGMQSSRPMGFFGVGHDAFHAAYMDLKNARGNSCCNGEDGRPTQARWNDETSTWDVMVDGAWRTLSRDEDFKVLTPDVLAAQGRERPDGQAHVFTDKSGKTLYCLIPPASGG